MVEVMNFVAVDDVGRVINPMIVEGQVQGGVAQGIGQALLEHRAKELFGAEHANVQPHAGAQTNMAVYMAALQPGDTILSLELAHGGHLRTASR